MRTGTLLLALVGAVGTVEGYESVDPRVHPVEYTCGDACVLTCTSQDPCPITLNCKPDAPCWVECAGDGACIMLQLTCPTSKQCSIRCHEGGCPMSLPAEALCFGEGCANPVGTWEQAPGPSEGACLFDESMVYDPSLTITGFGCEPGNYIANGGLCMFYTPDGQVCDSGVCWQGKTSMPEITCPLPPLGVDDICKSVGFAPGDVHRENDCPPGTQCVPPSWAYYLTDGRIMKHCILNPLIAGDVCKFYSVQSGESIDRETHCPAGTACVAASWSAFLPAGEVLKFCTAV